MRRKNISIDYIYELIKSNENIVMRKIVKDDRELFILYLAQLSDKRTISNSVIRPIMESDIKSINDIYNIAYSIIQLDDIFIDEDEGKIIGYILDGHSIILLPHEKKYIVGNTIKVEKRDVSIPEVENTLRGPKDAFVEDIDTNIALIRNRIRDESLIINKYKVGKRTKTDIALVYLNDVADSKIVNQISKKIKSINIDGIIDSAYIQKYIIEKKFNIFPQIGIVERSDSFAAEVLDGKVCIVVGGSNLALIIPRTLMEFFDSGDDHYNSIYLSIFTKYLRLLSVFINLTLTSLYVTIVSFHSEILPPQYILAIANSRSTVPFNSVVEAIIMEFVADILREASVRLPRQIGPAIGIVGTIVIGQAAVSAGLVSPLMVIIISLSTMCSFVAPDLTIMNSVRILKYFMLVITAFFGLFGFVIGLTLITINLTSLELFGIPYTAPLAPLNFKDLKNYVLSDITLSKSRASYNRPLDKKRQ